jgi:twitching motility two-component system response regulator PilG
MQAMEQAGNPILVIDDSSTIRRSAEIFLGQAGYTVVLAEDGFAALSVILDQRPVLVFCDIQMPRLDGFQTCALIRRHPEFRHLPVVMLSSRDGVFDRARGVLAGASAYLTKPFTKDSLLRTVDEQLAAAAALLSHTSTVAHDPLPAPVPDGDSAELSPLTTDLPSP